VHSVLCTSTKVWQFVLDPLSTGGYPAISSRGTTLGGKLLLFIVGIRMDLSSWLECKPELSFCNPYKNDANTMHGKGGRAAAEAHTEKSGSQSNSSLPSKSERR
jgi:hypothetical protein